MSNINPITDDLDDDDDDEFENLSDNEVIRKLNKVTRDQKKIIKQLQAENETNSEYRKRVALMDAKLPDSPQVKFFLDNYKGEYDPEVIRATAAEYGFIEADQTVTNEVNEVENMMQTMGGGGSPPAPGTQSAIEAEINAVTATGPEAARQIKAIMTRYGVYVPDEE